MQRYQPIAILLLRIATAANFLSPVASRLGLWGAQGSNWADFLLRTKEINPLAPAGAIPFLAVTATILETSIALLLLVGYKTRWAALAAAILTFLFATAMYTATGIKPVLDYAVLVDCTSALLLATMATYRWSIDALLIPRPIVHPPKTFTHATH